MIAPLELPDIAQPLLRWYDVSRRDLPWRKNHDPYRVWISEIMLQQTRVETVIPYYERFLRALPDVRALAEAPEERLLKLWEGLGYYSRARNLQKCAQKIVSDFGGYFPEDVETLQTLPGIGEYTAGAIASIAFEKPSPAVDGNVVRVAARILGDETPSSDPAFKKRVAEALARIYPDRRGDFTQSLMELGATVCLPNGEPQCLLCPLAGVCRAREEGRQDRCPGRPPEKKRTIEKFSVFLLRHQEMLALRKRPSKGLLAGLWELPHEESVHSCEEFCTWAKSRNLAPDAIRDLGTEKHIFTHIEWHMHVFEAFCAVADASFEWVSQEHLGATVALPTAFRKLLEMSGKDCRKR